jgi:hypothetical protein
MSLRRFTEAEIDKLRLMAECGHTGQSIARALDRRPQAIRVKCVELGVRLRRQAIANRRVRLPEATRQKLKATADSYNMTVVRFSELLLETIIRDKLFDAVLDVRSVKPTTATRPQPAPEPVRRTKTKTLSFHEALAPRLLGAA